MNDFPSPPKSDLFRETERFTELRRKTDKVTNEYLSNDKIHPSSYNTSVPGETRVCSSYKTTQVTKPPLYEIYLKEPYLSYKQLTRCI